MCVTTHCGTGLWLCSGASSCSSSASTPSPWFVTSAGSNGCAPTPQPHLQQRPKPWREQSGWAQVPPAAPAAVTSSKLQSWYPGWELGASSLAGLSQLKETCFLRYYLYHLAQKSSQFSVNVSQLEWQRTTISDSFSVRLSYCRWQTKIRTTSQFSIRNYDQQNYISGITGFQTPILYPFSSDVVSNVVTHSKCFSSMLAYVLQTNFFPGKFTSWGQFYCCCQNCRCFWWKWSALWHDCLRSTLSQTIEMC